MSDATTQRVSTERARELVGAATPGPWRISDPDGIAPRVSCLDFPICWVAGDTDGRPWIDEFEPGPGPLADAALIAAAPDLAADLIAARATIDTATKQRDNAFGYVESIEGALNDAGVQDWIEHWSGHPEEPPSAEQADPLSRVMMLIEERDALKRDLAAARDLRGVVPVEEHARAVREAWVVFCRPLYADRGRAASDADIAEHWRGCVTRTLLVARLTRSGVTEARAVALADGVAP